MLKSLSVGFHHCQNVKEAVLVELEGVKAENMHKGLRSSVVCYQGQITMQPLQGPRPKRPSENGKFGTRKNLPMPGCPRNGFCPNEPCHCFEPDADRFVR